MPHAKMRQGLTGVAEALILPQAQLLLDGVGDSCRASGKPDLMQKERDARVQEIIRLLRTYIRAVLHAWSKTKQNDIYIAKKGFL